MRITIYLYHSLTHTHTHSVSTTGIQLLVTDLNNQLDQTLTQMTKMNWSQWEEVGDSSQYVRVIEDIFGSYMPDLNRHLSAAFNRFFCDKFVAEFIPKCVFLHSLTLLLSLSLTHSLIGSLTDLSDSSTTYTNARN